MRSRARTSSPVPRVQLEVRSAGADHQVVTMAGEGGSYRRRPCSDCPWRVDATGEFPAEAFRHSARTAYDLSQHVFSCHQSGAEKPAVCAGFLLRGAQHNIAVRMGHLTGRFAGDIGCAGVALHESYRAMAIANGVAPDDPRLASCR